MRKSSFRPLPKANLRSLVVVLIALWGSLEVAWAALPPASPQELENRAQSELAIGAGHAADPFEKKARKPSKNKRTSAKSQASVSPPLTPSETPAEGTDAVRLAPQGEVATVAPKTELKSIRPSGWSWSVGVLAEVWRPEPLMTLGNGQQIDFRDGRLSSVPALNLELGLDDLDAKGTWGAYLGVGYTQSKIPYRTPIGFLYDDVILHGLRTEAGLRVGIKPGAWSIANEDELTLSESIPTGFTQRALSLQLKAGAGRMSWIQTSRFSEVAGSVDRLYAVGGADVLWAITPRWSAVVGAAYRSNLRNINRSQAASEQAGNLSLNEWNWSGGLIGSL